jgi:hypothetical protein
MRLRRKPLIRRAVARHLLPDGEGRRVPTHDPAPTIPTCVNMAGLEPDGSLVICIQNESPDRDKRPARALRPGEVLCDKHLRVKASRIIGILL